MKPAADLRLPSVDAVLGEASALIDAHGRTATLAAVRAALAARREARAGGDASAIVAEAAARLAADRRPSQRRVFNLTGTVLHTNLGRAPIAEAAVELALEAMRHPTNLEYELDGGRRGERDAHVRSLLRRLTGAEDALVVNNNAAAVVLLLNALAAKKEVPVSRGELIEIGGAFRVPDIMSRAGAKLVEVGTTNRTHLRDFEAAVGPKTALLMKVHPSNYKIEGFSASVDDRALADLAHARGLPYVVDLGAGQLIDLEDYGLPHEQTPAEAIAAGADLVTFSGDKLLGGPQIGLAVGRKDLIAKMNRNPLKRALRVDKIRLAVLEATLRLYLEPDLLRRRLPTLRLLTRPEAEIRAVAERLLPAVAAALGARATVAVESARSQIGSGALPVDLLPSACLAIRPAGKAGGGALNRLADRLRALPIPIVGRLEDGALKLDLRCLEDEAGFVAQLGELGT